MQRTAPADVFMVEELPSTSIALERGQRSAQRSYSSSLSYGRTLVSPLRSEVDLELQNCDGASFGLTPQK